MSAHARNTVRLVQTQHIALGATLSFCLGVVVHSIITTDVAACNTQLPTSSSAKQAPQAATVFDAFAERLRAYNDMVRAVGEHKLLDAREQYVRAQANGLEARAALLWDLVFQLESDLDRLNNTARAADRRIAVIARKARFAQYLLSGKPIPAFAASADAYRFFERQVKIEAGDKLYSLTIAPGSITADDFIDNTHPNQSCQPPQPRDLRNTCALMAWTLRMKYVARAGSRAEELFARLFRIIASVPRKTTDDINRYMDELRRKTYEVWKPVQIIGLEASSEGKRILENTGLAVGK